MLKTILATVIAGAFLTSMPLLASAHEEKPAGEKAEKAEKGKKKDKKDKKDEAKKDENAGGW